MFVTASMMVCVSGPKKCPGRGKAGENLWRFLTPKLSSSGLPEAPMVWQAGDYVALTGGILYVQDRQGALGAHAVSFLDNIGETSPKGNSTLA